MDSNNVQHQKGCQSIPRTQYKYVASIGMECPHCHKTVDHHMELCPHCGYPLHTDHCTFCGAPMLPGEKFCSECGNSIGGIVCPKCGTLNFRSFCKNCREPLDDLAVEAMAQAETDPAYQEVRRLVEEVEKAILKVEEEQTIIKQGDEPLEQDSTTEEPVFKKEETLAEMDFSLKLAKLNDAMQHMVPPSDMTPQMQRTYYSARDVKHLTKMKVMKEVCCGWVCNYCGCQHKCPEECVSPELGGKWITEKVESEEIVETWTKQ